MNLPDASHAVYLHAHLALKKAALAKLKPYERGSEPSSSRTTAYLPFLRRSERPDYAGWNGAALHAIDGASMITACYTKFVRHSSTGGINGQNELRGSTGLACRRPCTYRCASSPKARRTAVALARPKQANRKGSFGDRYAVFTGFQVPTNSPPTMVSKAMSVRREPAPRRLPGGGSLAQAINCRAGRL